MSPLILLGRYFWLLLLSNCAIRYRLSIARAQRPRYDACDKAEIHRYRRVWFCAQALPWIIIGLGVVSGHVKDTWTFFQPKDSDSNAFLIAFFLQGLILSLLFSWWLFTGGARKAVDLRLLAVFGAWKRPLSERGLKILAITCIVLTAAGVFGNPRLMGF